MKIKLVSDLHLEFSDITLTNNGVDVLILAGDIMIAEKVNKPESEKGIRFRNFLNRVSSDFPHVVYIAGNHEFYGGYWNKSLNILRDSCDLYPNVYFLENSYKIIDNVVFVGGTLWTDLNKNDPLTVFGIKSIMNDFTTVRNDEKQFSKLRPQDTFHRHLKTVEYIEQTAKEFSDKCIVVVGHHSPSFQSCHENYIHEHIMNGAYHSNLEHIMLDNSNIKLWVHGHTHHYFDYKIDNCRVVCNPRGYNTSHWTEESGWDPNLIIEV